MKKGIFLLTAIAAAITTVSCTKKESSEDLLSRIQAKGEIVIAMEGAWAPWTYHDEADNLTGYDVEVGRKIAEKLGVKATFVEVDWDGIFAGLDSKRYDIACNGVEITALIVRKDNDSITSYEDLAGKTTTNSIGSTYEALAQSYGATVITIDSFDQTLELVEQGRADATLNDNATFYYYQQVKPENNFKLAALTEDSSKVAVPMRKGAETATLKAAIDQAIKELKESGELAALSEKYFGADLSK